MCGIAGCVSLRGGLEPVATADLEAMAGAMRHRGPDGFGFYRDRDAALVHARLSIIDLATGQQPLCNEDGTLWVTFNGEIFNYVELRAELQALGHDFRTRSDTEVIVHAFEEWGHAAFARFNGQFALGIWDARRNKLVLARDRLGVRPLYRMEHAGRLWFASEIKALFAGAPDAKRSLDPVGLVESFTFWSPVAPQTAFAGVTQLEPGHALVIEGGKTSEVDFGPAPPAAPSSQPFSGTLDEAATAVRSALERAVGLRVVRSDVPVGSYLSGGLDSSLVAVLGREASPGPFLTFSVRFEDAEYDETPFQRAVSARIGSEHRDVVVGRRHIAEVFPEVVAQAEQPLLRTAPAPMFLLSRLVRQSGVKVVLTGEGADEMFAGYDLFREAKVRRFWARQPGSRWRPLLLDRLYPWLARSPMAQRELARAFFRRGLDDGGRPGFAHGPRWQSTAALQRLLRAEVRSAAQGVDVVRRFLGTLPRDLGRWPPLAQDQHVEIRTLLSGYLLSAQGDRMLMGNSVEGRFPFLDVDVADLAHSLPAAFKLRGLDEKHVLKRAAKGLVPDAIRLRPKQPYRAPDALAFVGEARPPWIGEVLSADAVRDAGVFDPAAVAALWRKCVATGGRDQFSNADNMALTGVISTGLLHRLLVRERPDRRSPAGPWTRIDRVLGSGANRPTLGHQTSRGMA